jgi:hypothetical protein
MWEAENLRVRIRASDPDPKHWKTLFFWHNLFKFVRLFPPIISSYILFSSSYSILFCTVYRACVCGRAGSVQFIHTFSTSFFPLPLPPPPRPLLWWPLCVGGGGGKTENCTCLIFFIFLSVFCFPLYTPTFLSSYLSVAPSGFFVFGFFRRVFWSVVIYSGFRADQFQKVLEHKVHTARCALCSKFFTDAFWKDSRTKFHF